MILPANPVAESRHGGVIGTALWKQEASCTCRAQWLEDKWRHITGWLKDEVIWCKRRLAWKTGVTAMGRYIACICHNFPCLSQGPFLFSDGSWGKKVIYVYSIEKIGSEHCGQRKWRNVLTFSSSKGWFLKLLQVKNPNWPEKNWRDY